MEDIFKPNLWEWYYFERLRFEGPHPMALQRPIQNPRENFVFLPWALTSEYFNMQDYIQKDFVKYFAEPNEENADYAPIYPKCAPIKVKKDLNTGTFYMDRTLQPAFADEQMKQHWKHYDADGLPLAADDSNSSAAQRMPDTASKFLVLGSIYQSPFPMQD